jgi:hypothetical protein
VWVFHHPSYTHYKVLSRRQIELLTRLFLRETIEQHHQALSQFETGRNVLCLRASNLRARLFHTDRNRRANARFLALKYSPEKVKEVLSRKPPAFTEDQRIA